MCYDNTTLVLMISFQISLCKLLPERQTVLDFAAARDDGCGVGVNENLISQSSGQITTTNMPTLIFAG